MLEDVSRPDPVRLGHEPDTVADEGRHTPTERIAGYGLDAPDQGGGRGALVPQHDDVPAGRLADPDARSLRTGDRRGEDEQAEPPRRDAPGSRHVTPRFAPPILPALASPAPLPVVARAICQCSVFGDSVGPARGAPRPDTARARVPHSAGSTSVSCTPAEPLPPDRRHAVVQFALKRVRHDLSLPSNGAHG